ncbi:hypothetical protein BG000_005140 [Podila horticola]|nr:hypothetical protein BG000_005140 [Podila horticola]
MAVLKILYEERTAFRETFMEWAANVRYHHSKMMNQLTVLKEIGCHVDEISDESNLPKLPEHKHFSNHPGYNLVRSQEFFQTYGSYVLMILRMIVYGFSNDNYEIPRLETFEILWGYDLDGCSSHVSNEKIGPLVSKAVSYLEGLSLPNRGTEMWLTEREAVAIQEFLDIPEGCSTLGELYRFTDSTHWFWTCKRHAYRRLTPGTMEALEDFVHICGGHVDTQLATLQLELYSRSQVDMLSTLLRNIEYTFHVITLDWKGASQQDLQDSLHKAVATKVHNSDSEYFLGSAAFGKARHLRLTGVSCDVHPQDNLKYKTDIFASLIYKNRDLLSVTVRSCPRPQEQCTYFSESGLPRSLPVYWIHSKQQQQEEPKYGWTDLCGRVYHFTEAIMFDNRNEFEQASQRLQDVLTEYGYQGVSTITTLRQYWRAEFDIQEGTLQELQIYDVLGLSEDIIGKGGQIRLLGVLNSLRILTVDVDDLDTDEVVSRMVKASPQLQELNISIQDGRALEVVEKTVKMWHSRSDPLRLTLLERNSDGRGRVIAQAVIRGHAYSSAGNNSTDIQGYNARPVNTQEWKLDIAAKVEFLQWKSDHVSTSLTDITAALLDMATEHFSSDLTSFKLDISHLGKSGLCHVQSILQRSDLSHLHVNCTTFDPSLTDFVCQILHSARWTILRSLVLAGSAVNEWTKLLTSISGDNTVGNEALQDLQMLRLWIQGSGQEPLCLLHSSVLFIHQLLYSNPSMEFALVNAYLQDPKDQNFVKGNRCS